MEAIHIMGELNEGHVSRLLAADEKAPLVLCSPGGPVEIARALCDVLLWCPRTILAVGEIASAAIPVLACGSKGRRFCGKSCSFVFHLPYTERPGIIQEADAANLTNQLVGVREWLHATLGDNTDRNPTWWDTVVRNGQDTQWSADDALLIGLADAVLGGDNTLDASEPLIDPSAAPADDADAGFEASKRNHRGDQHRTNFRK